MDFFEIILKVEKNTKDFPVKLTGDFFYKYVTFRLIFKKSYQQGVFEDYHPDPNLSKILNPQEICRDNFFLYIQVYMGIMFIIS